MLGAAANNKEQYQMCSKGRAGGGGGERAALLSGVRWLLPFYGSLPPAYEEDTRLVICASLPVPDAGQQPVIS